MSSASTESRIENICAPLVDPTGTSPDKTPGLVVGFVNESGSGVVGFGTTRLRRGRQPNGSTFFGIGSVTKIFTGLILAKAVTEGRIRLDGSISDYLKDDLNLDPSITPRQLVTHTAGLPRLPDNILEDRGHVRRGRHDPSRASVGSDYSREHLAACLRSAGSANASADAPLKYSNLGFGILGIAMADHLGFRSFDSMIRAYITGPLQMTSTGAKSPTLRGKVRASPAIGHERSRGRLRPAPFPDMGVLEASGELISTADDMIRLLRAFTGISRTPLGRACAEAMTPLHSAGRTQIGYGIKVVPSRSGVRTYGKGGSTAGYTSLTLWIMEPKVGLVLLANRGHFKRLDLAGWELIRTVAPPPDQSMLDTFFDFRYE